MRPTVSTQLRRCRRAAQDLPPPRPSPPRTRGAAPLVPSRGPRWPPASRRRPRQKWSPQAVIETALADVQQRKAAWTRSDLTRAINAALPDYLGIPTAPRWAGCSTSSPPTPWPRPFRSTPPAPAPTSCPTRCAARTASRPTSPTVPSSTARPITCGPSAFSPPPRPRAVPPPCAPRSRGGSSRVCGSRASNSVSTSPPPSAVCSPPAPALSRWSARPAPASRSSSARSPAVGANRNRSATPLRGGIRPCDVADRHRRPGRAGPQLPQRRPMARHPGAPVGRRRFGQPATIDGDEAWRLHPGDLVVVDESAMTDTPALVAIHRRVEDAGAKLLLVGDHRQFSAVGAGGGMELLAAAGARYELAEARRFTAEWERDASLRLRASDAGVLRDYHQHGRLLDAGTRGQAEERRPSRGPAGRGHVAGAMRKRGARLLRNRSTFSWASGPSTSRAIVSASGPAGRRTNCRPPPTAVAWSWPTPRGPPTRAPPPPSAPRPPASRPARHPHAL
jgi:hypothetical protein